MQKYQNAANLAQALGYFIYTHELAAEEYAGDLAGDLTAEEYKANSAMYSFSQSLIGDLGVKPRQKLAQMLLSDARAELARIKPGSYEHECFANAVEAMEEAVKELDYITKRFIEATE